MNTKLMLTLFSVFLFFGCGKSVSADVKLDQNVVSLNDREVLVEECESLRHKVIDVKSYYNGRVVEKDLYLYMLKKSLIPVISRNIKYGYVVEDIVPCESFNTYYTDINSYYNNEQKWDFYVDDFRQVKSFLVPFEEKSLINDNLKNEKSSGRVLILDSGSLPSDIVFNKDNLLGIFDFNKQDGHWIPLHPLYKISSHMENLISDLNSVGGIWSHPIVSKDISEKIQNEISMQDIYIDYSYGSHIYNVFNFVAGMSPKSKVSLNIFPANIINIQPFLDNDKVKIDEFYKNYYDDLRKYVTDNNIEYINISQAPKDRRFMGSFGTNYNAFDLYNKSMVDFIKKISRELPVIVFWGMPNESTESIERSNFKDFFCKDIPKNLIRVGYISTDKFKFSTEGDFFNPSILDRSQKNNIKCADVFINSFIDDKRLDELDKSIITDSIIRIHDKWWNESSLFYSLNGIIRPFTKYMATSWATPLALSMTLKKLTDYNKNNNQITFKQREKFIEKYIKGRMFDPIANKQLEIFR